MQLRRLHSISAAVLFSASLSLAQSGIGPITSSVPNARPKIGVQSTVIVPGFFLNVVVAGKNPVENPSGLITNFGLLSDGTLTEPDQNAYVVFPSNPGGPTAGYNYGRHFVYQGHENSGNLAYVTRVNLDVVDPAHKVTLLTPVDPTTGLTNLNSIDGSTLDPFTHTLLFTEEAGSSGGAFQVSTNWPPKVDTLYGILGQGGFEGIHTDDWGNLLIIEDAGGVTVNVDPNDPNSPKVPKQPNSFVYRFVPTNTANLLDGGKLQALRVFVDKHAVVFHANAPLGDTFSNDWRCTLQEPRTQWIGSQCMTPRLTALPPSMPMPQLKQRARLRSSVRKTRNSFRVQTSRPFTSVQLEILIRAQALRRSQLVGPGVQSSGLILTQVGKLGRFPSSCWGMPRTPRSITSLSLTTTP
jgi:hypothetical protein